jgi:hypothetical protein
MVAVAIAQARSTPREFVESVLPLVALRQALTVYLGRSIPALCRPNLRVYTHIDVLIQPAMRGPAGGQPDFVDLGVARALMARGVARALTERGVARALNKDRM